MITIAVCQINISHGNTQKNLEKVIEYLCIAGDEDADLVVFPELCLCGHQFNNFKDVRQNSIRTDSQIILDIQECCRNYDMTAVVGLIENANGMYFNTAAVVGTNIVPFLYRKVHLPVFGADQFVSRGNLGFTVFDLNVARIGVNISNDLRFPESGRILALQGAEIVAVPTCETISSNHEIDILTRARALENHVYYVLANRVGFEKGVVYDGKSKIIDTTGEVICMASDSDEEIIFAEVDVTSAEDKKKRN